MSSSIVRAIPRVFVALHALALVRCATASSSETDRVLPPEVEVVEIAGAPAVDTSDLVEELAHHPPLGLVFKERARLDELALEIDRRRVESFFREQGYFAVEVADPEVAPYGEGVLVRFVVRPGSASRVRTLIVEGAPDENVVGETALRALLELREGELFTYPAYVRGKERLRAHLFNSGYAHA